VRTIAREVLSSSEAAAKEGDHLTRLAVLLEESVKGFKIDATKITDVSPEGRASRQDVEPVKQLPAPPPSTAPRP